MSEREGIGRIASDARAALNRLIAGVRVKHVPVFRYREPRRLSCGVKCRQKRYYYPIDTRSRGVRFSVLPDQARLTERISGTTVKVRADFKPEYGQVSVFGVASLMVSKVACGFYFREPVTVKPVVNKPGIIQQRGIRIKGSVTVDALPPAIRKPGVHDVSVCRKVRVERDLDVALSLPVVISPTPWSALEKSTIVLCFDILKKKARDLLGHDPARELEMLAVYSDVEMSYVKRYERDADTGELKLYMHDRNTARLFKSRKCAIIIGLVKGTGRVLRVTMPMGNPSHGT